MKWLFLEPSDVWLFRDGRPFAAGEGHAAETLYPPSPFTVQGALRSWLLGREMVDWHDFRYQSHPDAVTMAAKIGHPEQKGVAASLGVFSMRGPFRGRMAAGRAEILYPAPADIYHTKDKQWRVLRPAKTTATMDWGAELQPLLPDPRDPHEKPDEETAGLLDHNALLDYLEGHSFRLLRTPEFERELRLGIAMDYAAGRAADRMLYLAEFARLQPPEAGVRHGLLVETTDALDWSEADIISIGGESRAALVQRLSLEEAPQSLPLMAPAQRFKIVLLTPAWFADGWQPKNGDWAGFLRTPAEAKLKCVAAAVGRPLYLGGWDAARGGHKPLRGFVPPGSVFYFEAEQSITLPTAITETPPGEPEFDRQGLGAFVAGSWEWLE